LKTAKKAHGDRWAWLKRRPKPRPEPRFDRPEAENPKPPIPEPPADLKPRIPLTLREPAHPLSFSAFKRQGGANAYRFANTDW
jgi:hypothetical protein